MGRGTERGMELAGKEECSLGYSKLTYEEYIENPEVYLARGILAPKWANELYGKGYKGVCAIDFYDDIFGGDLEEHRMPEDYRTGCAFSTSSWAVCFFSSAISLLPSLVASLTTSKCQSRKLSRWRSKSV